MNLVISRSCFAEDDNSLGRRGLLKLFTLYIRATDESTKILILIVTLILSSLKISYVPSFLSC